jgi:methyl-accepting chemotaxis protein
MPEGDDELEELESTEITAQGSGWICQLLIQGVQTALSHSSESNTEMSQDLGNLKANAEFINENVVRAFEIADNLANTAKEAFELSENVQSGVKIVTDALGASLQNTEELFTQSKKITRILEIMSDISEKIHILSINASIVSARAGVSRVRALRW